MELFSYKMLHLGEKKKKNYRTQTDRIKTAGIVCYNLVGTFQTPVKVLLHRADMYPTLFQ